MEQEIEKIKPGKPWKVDSYHKTYEAADALRNKLLNIWKDNEKHKGMQVKVHRMSSKDQFAVKTRMHPDFEVKKETKNGKKNRNSRKGNSNKRKVDVNETSV
tara:strand:+ start:2026 stop:2331 length:306 start_codon:yes stop_codon:yes gene_type:complete